MNRMIIIIIIKTRYGVERKEQNNDQWFIANDNVNVAIIIAPDKTGFGQQPNGRGKT